ncbi:MAG TPA: TadE/TadG family type IV pilus assembly protein [Rhizobiaceae bacterium]|nr:TadE/TadG family type IV pilus assembly protein [Rhizobiaceae bacterium]
MGPKRDDNHEQRRRPRSLFTRFLGDRKGSTAIEFTMLAIPFSMLVFAILESCISFAGQQVLANTTDDIARQVRTGQRRDLDKETLEDLVCARIQFMVAENCPGLIVDLRQYDTFTKAAAEKIKYTADNDIDTTGFDVKPGGKGTKNMLRIFYKWPVMTDLMRRSMSNLKDGKTLHFASVTWQNEPYD